MNVNELRYKVTDWFKERRYAQGKLPLIVICVVLALCSLWIASFFVGGSRYGTPTPVFTPRDLEARRITEELKADDRFQHVNASASFDNDTDIVITGEVYTPADRAALEARVRQITSTYTVSIGEIVVMNAP